MNTCAVCGKATELALNTGEVVVLEGEVVVQVGLSTKAEGTVCPKCVERMVRDQLLQSVMMLRGGNDR